MLPIVSIVIPVYNQPDLLQRCLHSITQQTFRDFQIVIIDDNSTIDYSSVIATYSSFPIQYFRNSVNKGAMSNMKFLLETEWNTKYFILFHEDDMMHPQFLQNQIKLMENNSEIAFSGTFMEYFEEDVYNSHFSQKNYNTIEKKIFYIPSDFLASIFLKEEICFGSIIYRTSLLNNPTFDVARYGPICDRPFLLSIIKKCSYGCLIKAPLVYYRDHGPEDKRFSNLSRHQLVNFLRTYKDLLNDDLALHNKFLTYASNEALWFCKISDEISFLDTYKIFILCLSNSIVSLKHLEPKGLRSLGIYPLALLLKKIKDFTL
ncbi:glycosyltransferase family 2 protein [Pontibacter sp. BT310]|uniref:Glycosyltransferase n=1 Tax=Pontibacter populi TaxID=890055 RepID=A0ABS6XHH3_9BACT|nr:MULTISPECIES: glycosyltransferase family 2 protein [Pontibacter]MBJ6119797.1 glycosyltransferase family 2 protein [Pontibacter sp. BT310]MBR0572226.1 glycosyltransferase family 2 protein [Microvirga sp. STS03]MBW3366650.1 glycosyltransferase [Pontibacter populi]